jgi:hypothetical protein
LRNVGAVVGDFPTSVGELVLRTGSLVPVTGAANTGDGVFVPIIVGRVPSVVGRDTGIGIGGCDVMVLPIPPPPPPPCASAPDAIVIASAQAPAKFIVIVRDMIRTPSQSCSSPHRLKQRHIAHRRSGSSEKKKEFPRGTTATRKLGEQNDEGPARTPPAV